MQTSSIPNITNLGATPLASKAPDSHAEPRFGQMLERQMSQREASKPVEAPKPAAPRQDTKAPANNSGNVNGTANAETNTNKQDDASATATSAAATTDAATSTSGKSDAAIKKDGKTAESKTAADETMPTNPADATLAASAAVMALVANAGSNSVKPAASVESAANANTVDAARSTGNAAAVDFAAKLGARDTVSAATIDAAVAQAAKAGADGFGSTLQAAGKGLDRESVALLPADLARGNSNDLAQIAPQLSQTAFEIAPPSGPHPGDILAPRVGNDNWNQALGQRMVWMVAGTEQSASLTLNPPDLGPMQVVLHVSNGQADASFFAAQPEVRQALEAALPKLREMLGEAGVTLGQTNVSAGQPQQQPTADQRQFDSRGAASSSAGNTAVDTATATTPARRITGGNGMVDTFA